jgi:hypothetical protein
MAQHQLNAGVNPIDLRAQNAFICHFITFSELCGEFLLACCLLAHNFTSTMNVDYYSEREYFWPSLILSQKD